MEVRPGNILVAVRDPRNLYYLRQVLAKTDTTKTDVVVMTSRVYHREHSFSGSEVVDTSEVFKKYEQELFTAVVTAAEKEGKHVSLAGGAHQRCFRKHRGHGAALAFVGHCLRLVEQAHGG